MSRLQKEKDRLIRTAERAARNKASIEQRKKTKSTHPETLSITSLSPSLPSIHQKQASLIPKSNSSVVSSPISNVDEDSSRRPRGRLRTSGWDEEVLKNGENNLRGVHGKKRRGNTRNTGISSNNNFGGGGGTEIKDVRNGGVTVVSTSTSITSNNNNITRKLLLFTKH